MCLLFVSVYVCQTCVCDTRERACVRDFSQEKTKEANAPQWQCSLSPFNYIWKQDFKRERKYAFIDLKSDS